LIVRPSFSRPTFSNGNFHDPGCVGAGAIVLICILGIVIRLYACQHTFIVNPDGVYYIHQARAIYYGEWDRLTTCSLGFLSNYPFFIAGAYALIHHWIDAARCVSLVFGSMTLIPLYLLCRRFFDRDISSVTTLLFAVIPVFVAGSADVVRGPVCWFFLTLGLYFFVRSDATNYRLLLLLSCLSFLMGSWARIESLLFVLVSSVYLLAVPQEKRIQKWVWFTLPLIVALFLVFSAILFLDTPLEKTLRLKEVVQKLSAPIIAYEALRAGLAQLMTQHLEGAMPHFLHKTRHLVWLVALGTVVKYMIRAYFYLFFIILLLGLGGLWQEMKADRRIFYLSLAALSAFVLLYLHVLQMWMMFDRFWGIFMLPACVLIGFGLQKTLFLMTTRYRVTHLTALSIVCLLILACSLPKDLKFKEADKIVYKEIGEMIAHREGNAREIKIVKSLRTPNWTPFYANLNYEGAPCPKTDFGIESSQFDETVFKDYEGFVGYLKKNNVTYFLWEEGAWPKNGFDFLITKDPQDFMEIGVWRHPDTGRMILFKVS